MERQSVDGGLGRVLRSERQQRRPEGWTSADAAGLAILPGLVRYDEVFGADEIRHAFRVTVRATNGYVWPASHRAGSNSQALPMGARLRLKASKDLSGVPAGAAEDLPRDAALRPDRRRQRIGHVHQRRVRSALEQRRPQPGVPLADRQRLRGDRARLAWRRQAACAAPRIGGAVHVLAERPLVVAVWAAAAGAEEYVIEVGSAPGLVEPLVALDRCRHIDLSAIAPAGPLLRAASARRNRCGAGRLERNRVVI